MYPLKEMSTVGVGAFAARLTPRQAVSSCERDLLVTGAVEWRQGFAFQAQTCRCWTTIEEANDVEEQFVRKLDKIAARGCLQCL